MMQNIEISEGVYRGNTVLKSVLLFNVLSFFQHVWQHLVMMCDDYVFSSIQVKTWLWSFCQKWAEVSKCCGELLKMLACERLAPQASVLSNPDILSSLTSHILYLSLSRTVVRSMNISIPSFLVLLGQGKNITFCRIQELLGIPVSWVGVPWCVSKCNARCC